MGSFSSPPRAVGLFGVFFKQEASPVHQLSGTLDSDWDPKRTPRFHPGWNDTHNFQRTPHDLQHPRRIESIQYTVILGTVGVDATPR